MTNGEKIVNTFHGKVSKNDGIVYFSTDGWIYAYADEWWNTEYKEPTTEIDCEHTDCNNCVNHKYCDYERTNKNDLEVESDLVSSIVEKISKRVTETREEFIFETIRPYCENVVQMKISKRDLEQALLKYYGKNDFGVDYIKKSDAIDIIQDMHGLARADVISDAVNRIITMPSVTPQEPILDKIYDEISYLPFRPYEGKDTLDRKDVLQILDKYKADRSVEDGNDD